MNQMLSVTKRDGTKELIDLDKIHKVITWAAEGLDRPLRRRCPRAQQQDRVGEREPG